FDIIQHHCYSDPRFLLQGLYCGNHSSQLRRFGLITASGFTGLDLVSFNENSLIGMAEKISDDRLRREAKELLDGKAKTLLDNKYENNIAHCVQSFVFILSGLPFSRHLGTLVSIWSKQSAYDENYAQVA
ncbi:hypothetical protein Vafri_6014, partial [Volvox africanus]